MSLKRVTVRCRVETVCPIDGNDTDINEVAITWSGTPFVEAEELTAMVHAWDGRKVTCENLAECLADEIALALVGNVRVVVTQIQGHGVEAEAEAEA